MLAMSSSTLSRIDSFFFNGFLETPLVFTLQRHFRKRACGTKMEGEFGSSR
jgi:hypothetical protein